MKIKEKALIKDLELQIDYLVGYSPSGLHWKQEYYQRKALIDNTLIDEATPPQVVDKINNIQESLYKLRNSEANNQDYLMYSHRDYIIEHPIRYKHWSMAEYEII